MAYSRLLVLLECRVHLAAHGIGQSRRPIFLISSAEERISALPMAAGCNSDATIKLPQSDAALALEPWIPLALRNFVSHSISGYRVDQNFSDGLTS
jgi:hypothetical protein